METKTGRPANKFPLRALSKNTLLIFVFLLVGVLSFELVQMGVLTKYPVVAGLAKIVAAVSSIVVIFLVWSLMIKIFKFYFQNTTGIFRGYSVALLLLGISAIQFGTTWVLIGFDLNIENVLVKSIIGVGIFITLASSLISLGLFLPFMCGLFIKKLLNR